MPWTKLQIKVFMVAARAAGWNEDQRYMAMRHCGCPTRSDGVATPSVNHPRNTNALFERCMALAESCAGQQGVTIAPPKGKRSWREAERGAGDRMRDLAHAIVEEAIRRAPDVFFPTRRVAPDQVAPGLLDATIQHVCGNDPREVLGFIRECHVATWRLSDLDTGQLYRVVESLKAQVGRVLLERGIVPASFSVPASARRRAARKAGAA